MRVFPELTLASLIAGVGAGLWLTLSVPSAWPLFWLASGGLTIAVAFRAVGLPVGPMLLASAVLFGVWRGADAGPAELPIVPNGSIADIVIKIEGSPVASGHRLRYRGQVLARDGERPIAVPDGTKLLVYGLPPPELVQLRDWPYLLHGDLVRVSGRLERPEPIGDFDYAAWLESQSIPAILWARQTRLEQAGDSSTPTAVLHKARNLLASGLKRNISAPQSGLAQALLLGLRAELPQDLKHAFRTAGMSHLLAISGLHVGIVMAMSVGIMSAIAGRGSAIGCAASVSVVWGYALLSGLDPPVVRAAIMGSLVLAQAVVGRGTRGLTALAFAGAMMVMIQPGLLGNLSFQLSFTAMAGVIVALPIITALTAAVTAPFAASGSWAARWGQHGLSLLIASAVISITTTVATLPLVVMHFDAVPLMSVPATILAMPALPAALVGAGATALVAAIAAPVATVLGVLAWGPLSWLMWVANNMPPVLLAAHWLTAPVALVWYFILLLAAMTVSTRGVRRSVARLGRRPRWRPGAAGAVLAGVAPILLLAVILLVSQRADSAHDSRLHVYVLDVGQGDAILVVTPEGRTLLMDGGPAPSPTLSALGRLLPVGDRTLDVVAASHLDADHAGGLGELPLAVEEKAEVAGREVCHGWTWILH